MPISPEMVGIYLPAPELHGPVALPEAQNTCDM
jgi:hypothetical protein